MTSTDNQATKQGGGAAKAPELVVYRASAGSGKTFTLAVEYIALLMKNPEAYRNILAVTFTNKATAEMKERILSQLYGIGKGLRGSDDYLEALREKTGLAEEEIRGRASEALRCIIHDYSRFHVETIDTFSVSVMRNLAKELNVGTNMNIELNSDDVLSEAVDTMVESLSQGADVLNCLSAYIMERIEEDKAWRVFDSIKSFGRQIFNEQFVEKGDKLREQLQDPASVDNLKKALHATREEVRHSLRQKGDDFFNALNHSGIADKEFNGTNLKAAISYFQLLQAGDIDKVKIGKALAKLLVSADDWTKDSARERGRVIALVNSSLKRILVEAEEQRKLFVSCNLSSEHLNDLRLLAEIDSQMKELNTRGNRYLLADVNKLLRTMIADSDTPFVFEKIGATVSNIMMDEFQDTSRLQWHNFKPLITEGLAGGNSSLIVGDVKQSIYRWRNGDWNILNSELRDKFGPFRIREKTQERGYDENKNYRSARNIVLFNNMFFRTAIPALALRCHDVGIADSSPLENAYREVEQTSVKTADRGYVRVSILPHGLRDEEYPSCTLEQLVCNIRLLKAQGVEDKDIAILVRKKDKIKLIADRFSSEGDLKLVSDEAFRLDASAAVGIIVDALRCLSLPNVNGSDSKLFVAKLATAYQQEVHPQDADPDAILLSSVDDILGNFLPEAFSLHIEDLRLMPIYELAERLYAIFSLSAIPGQDGYLCAFLDAVSDYCGTHPSELSAFVAYWDESLCRKTLPVGEVDGIRILTIHKAKGLEFHTVLVPFCDWQLDTTGRLADNVWCETHEDPFLGLSLLPIKYKEDMENSVFGDDYYNEKMQQCVDNINLLYVAFTRAKENLLVWTPKDSDSATSRGWSVPRVLSDTLSTLSALSVSGDEAGGAVYELGTPLPPLVKADTQETNILLAKPEPAAMRMLSTQNHFHFRQSNRSAEFIDGEGAENQYIDRGLVLHNYFSRIHSTADALPAARRLRDEGIISGTQEVMQLADFALAALRGIEDKHWFDGSWQLFNECTIIYPHEGHIETRRPDRVMMKDGAVVVLDYKFAKKQPEHRRQVGEYMELMRRMGHKNVSGYLWYVLAGELEEV